MGLLSCILLAPTPTHSQAADGSPSPVSITIPLEYREAQDELLTLPLSISTQSDPFPNEPAVSPRSVRRGTFRVGSMGELRFIWDQRQGQLYLDLNRNADLSDDTEGRFSCANGARSENYQQFDNVRFDLPINGITQKMRFTVSLYAFGQVGGSIALHSYWSGQTVLAGREWELGIVPTAFGPAKTGNDEILLLRPWTAVGTGFNVGDGSLDAFACGSNLFFQGQAFDVQRKVSAAAPLHFEIALTTRETALGQVWFTGQHVRRALLADGPWTVVIEEPTGTLSVPQGTYRTHMVHLRKGDAEARLERGWSGPGALRQPVIVHADTPALVTAGGPLTNTVTVQRRGQSLVFNYQLIGAGGETYRPGRNSGEPPRVAIYHGERLLESGNFEFG
jgi:hypothetical protein